MPSSIEERHSERTPAALAWQRYLEETRSATDEGYELVEELAWRRLRAALTRLAQPAPAEGRHRHLFHRLSR